MKKAMVAAALVVVVLAPARAADMEADDKTIRGTISVRPDLAGHVMPGDRLILKIYHPGATAELDATYRIVSTFTLPTEFRFGPAIDMNGRTRYHAYIVEVFTDKDSDVLSVAPGEVMARSDGPVPLGTTGLRLMLDTPRQ
jgi:hypothetical protein